MEINRTSVYYTAAIADLEREEQIKSRYIVGWELSDTIDTAPVLEAGKSAIAAYGKPGIINIDQGCQFTSEDYTAFLQTETIRQSMDGKARWVDNVIIERWFRSLKCDNIYINENAAARG